MRSYLILKEKAKQFDADPEVQEILASLNVARPDLDDHLSGFSPEKADALKSRTFDAASLAEKPLPYERLDQKLFDILMGVA